MSGRGHSWRAARMTDGEVRFREFESDDGLAGEVDAANVSRPKQ
jgi:hypothetical protein